MASVHFSQFLRLEYQAQGASMVEFQWGLANRLQMRLFSCPHLVGSKEQGVFPRLLQGALTQPMCRVLGTLFDPNHPSRAPSLIASLWVEFQHAVSGGTQSYLQKSACIGQLINFHSVCINHVTSTQANTQNMMNTTEPSQSLACSQGNPFLAGNAIDWLWPFLNFCINGGIPCILGLASLTQQYEMHPLAVCSNSLVWEYKRIDQFYYWWTDIWVVSWVWLSGIVLLWNTWWFYFTFLLAVFLKLELLELKV